MKIGFGLPVSGSWATPEYVTLIARRAEELGYHELWTFQRLLSPVDGSWGEMYRSVTDPMVTLGYAAAITSRIRLGVAVVNLPFVSPVLLAKQAATVDILSGGRFDLGLGLGWSDEEYTASGATKKNQGRRAEEYLATLRTLWTDEVVAHRGEFYRIPESRFEPKPVQRPHPPILLGGAATPALRRAGRLADGWVSSSRTDLTVIGAAIGTVKQAAVDAGRDPSTLRFVCRGPLKIRSNGERGPLMGTLDEIRSDFALLEEQGITELNLDLNFDPHATSAAADPAVVVSLALNALTALSPT